MSAGTGGSQAAAWKAWLRPLRHVPGSRSLRRSLRRCAAYGRFVGDYFLFRRAAAGRPSRFPLRWSDRLPFLDEATAGTVYDRHYVYHPAWAARVLARTRPACHVDISSSLHFVSLVSAFIPVRFYDYRPADLVLEGLSCERANLMALPFADRSVVSLSCMHVVEHVGLGRYGDPLDPDGDLKALRELQRVLAPGGDLLVVVPVGVPALRFNGHRIYGRDQIVEALPELALEEFTLIPEAAADGAPVPHATADQVAHERYGCGCYWFRRSR